MGGDRVPSQLDAIRDKARGQNRVALMRVLARVQALQKNLEDLGHDVHIAITADPKGNFVKPNMVLISIPLDDLEKGSCKEGVTSAPL